MTNDTKDCIQYGSAISMLLFGILITSFGFYVEPKGQVHESILFVLGQCVIFAGSVYGIGLYVKTKVDNRMNSYLNGNK